MDETYIEHPSPETLHEFFFGVVERGFDGDAALRLTEAVFASSCFLVAEGEPFAPLVDGMVRGLRSQVDRQAETIDGYRRALRLIANGQECENYTSTHTCRDEGSGRTPKAVFTANRWCDTCIANAALEGTLP